MKTPPSTFRALLLLLCWVAGASSAFAQSGLLHIQQGPTQPVAGGVTEFSGLTLPQGSPPWSWIKRCTATSFNGISGPLDAAHKFLVFNVPVIGGPLFVRVVCEAESLTQLAASPGQLQLNGYGQKAQIQVRGTFKDGTVQPLSLAADGTTYTSSAPKVVSVSADGQVQALGNGSATITVKNGTHAATVAVSSQFGPALGLFVSPSVVVFDKAGQQQALEVSVLYASGIRQDVTATASLSSSRTTVANTSQQTVTAVGSGQATITVKAAGQTAALLAIVKGTAQLLSLSASPSPLSLKFKGSTAQLKVIGTYSDSSTLDLTLGTSGIVYKSSNPAVAKISADGLVEAVSNGSATLDISHPAGNKPTTQVQVQVTAPSLTKLTVSPNPIRLKKAGETVQLKVTATYSDNSTQDVTSLALTTYTPSDGTIVSASKTGLISALKLGQTSLAVKHDTQTVQVPVQVAAKLLKSLAFGRSSLSMVQNTLDTAGVTAQLKLTATYDDNSTADVSGDAQTSYQSSNTSVATVSTKGVVFAGSSAGNSTLTATHQGKRATLSVTIARFGFRTVTKLDLAGVMEDVAVVGGVAYVAAGSAGLHLVDVSDPTQPKLLRTLEVSEGARFVRAWGEYLLVADGKAGLRILGVHDVAVAASIQSLATPGGEAHGAGFWQKQLFVAGGKAGVIAYDMSQIPKPQRLGATGSGDVLSVDADSRYVAAVDQDKVLLYDRQTTNWWGSPPLRSVALVGARKVLASGSTTPGTFYVAAASGVYRIDALGQSSQVTTGTFASSPFDLSREQGWMLSSGAANTFPNAPVFFLAANPLNAVYRGFQSYGTFGSFLKGKGLAARRGYTFVAADDGVNKHMLQIGQYRRWVDYDQKAPTVALLYPPDNSTQAEDRDLHFVVRASDDREVDKVEFRIDGKLVATQTTRPFVLSYPAPEISSPSKVVLDVIAYDPAGNKQSSAAVTVNLTPIADATKPTIALQRPIDGQEVEIGKALGIETLAQDDKRVAEVRFFVDNTQVARTSRRPFAAAYIIPSNTADGATLKIRADVVDYGGQVVRSTEHTVTAVKLTEITADIGESDTSFDNKRIAIRGRTLKIDGSHTFKSLWIDGGGVLKHSATTTTKVHKIEIQADFIYVGPRSRIDVDALGYLAAQAGGNGAVGRTLGNSTTHGAKFNQGGAHGGPGGYAQTTAPPPPGYGSLFDPLYPGGGAGSTNAQTPPTGGGVVRLQSQVLLLDGVISAGGGGKDTYTPGGAGGSIALRTQNFAGRGAIHADGGGGELGPIAGAGGRIAIYADHFDGFDRAKITAFGHQAIASNSRDTFFCGGAGTIFLKSKAETYGTLIVDNGSPQNNIQVTPLPQVGKSTVTGVTRNTLTHSAANWEPGQLIGHHVNPNLSQSKVYRITANTATTLTLDVGSDDLTTLAKSGDTYQGVLFLDGLLVSGRAQISTADQLRVGAGGLTLKGASLSSGALTLDANSDFTLDRSQLTVTTPLKARNIRLLNGTTVTVPAATAAGGPATLQITATQNLQIDSQSKIDLKGKGYLQGSPASSGRGHHHSNSTTGGALNGAGGSHGGVGELNKARYSTTTQSNRPYGSLFTPREAGAGGGCIGSFTCRAGAGGGVVRIQADTVELQGSIEVDGEVGNGGGSGAGGSIWIQTRALLGAGTLSAKGGDAPQIGSHGAGGGGRIAVYTTTLSGFDPTKQIRAYAGARVHPTNPPAGSGTIFLKTSTQTHGELHLDHDNLPNPSPPGFGTVLLAVGSGTITGLAPQQLTNTGAAFAPDDQLAGLWLKADITKSAVFRILTSAATLLGTDPSDGSLTAASAVGRTYRGVLRLDKLVLRNKARASTLDELDAASIQVSSDSAFQAQNLSLPACPTTCGANLDCQVFGCGSKTTCISNTCQ